MPLLPQTQLVQRAAENLLGGRIEVEAQPGKIQQAQGVVALNIVEVVGTVQNRDGEGTLQLLRHEAQRVPIQPTLLLQQLRGNIAVRLNFAVRQPILPFQRVVVVQNAVVRQCKGYLSRHAPKRVIVAISSGGSLRRHPRVPHHNCCVRRKCHAQPVGRHRLFVDVQRAAGVVGNAGGVGSPCFAFGGENR